MLVKIVIVFLGAMVIVGMIGKMLFQGGIGRLARKTAKPATCLQCGRPVVGRGPCACRG